MNSYNSVTMIGNLVKNAEHKTFPSGKAATTITLAASKKFVNKQTNEVKEEVCYIECLIWSPNLQWAKDLQKGQRVFVNGYLKLDQWEGPDKKKQYKHRIYAEQLMTFDRDKPANAPQGSSNNGQVFESDLPF